LLCSLLRIYKFVNFAQTRINTDFCIVLELPNRIKSDFVMFVLMKQMCKQKVNCTTINFKSKGLKELLSWPLNQA
jgi:hypothetical protein